MTKKIGLIVGSLRQGSFSGQLAQALLGMFPEGWQVELVSISQLSLFNQDYNDEGQAPSSYAPYRQTIAALDGVLFVTPEHNRSMPAALKNAIDIASMPFGENRWENMPAAIISASPGQIGGFAATHHLRQSMICIGIAAMPTPEAYLARVDDLLEGGMPNPATRDFLQSIVDDFVRWVMRNARSS